MSPQSEPGQDEQQESPPETGRARPERSSHRTRFSWVVRTIPWVLGAYVALALASHLTSLFKPLRWISPFGLRTEVETLETLLTMEGVEEAGELLAGIYTGEAIVSAADLKSRLREELVCVAVGGELVDPAPDSLVRWLLSEHYDMAFEDARSEFKREIQEHSSNAQGAATLMQSLDDWLGELGAPPEELVYLVRGSVKVWYDLNVIGQKSTCKDAEGRTLEVCDLSRTSTLEVALDEARKMTTVINPYYAYDDEELDEEWRHGWVILRGDYAPAEDDHGAVKALRILAHEELRSAAIRQGVLELADGSLRNTIKQMVSIFHDRSVTVEIQDVGPAERASATAGCIKPYEKIPLSAGSPRLCNGCAAEESEAGWDGHKGRDVKIVEIVRKKKIEKDCSPPCWELELNRPYDLREFTISFGESHSESREKPKKGAKKNSKRGLRLMIFNDDEPVSGTEGKPVPVSVVSVPKNDHWSSVPVVLSEPVKGTRIQLQKEGESLTFNEIEVYGSPSPD